jgi:hypothetical protein
MPRSDVIQGSFRIGAASVGAARTRPLPDQVTHFRARPGQPLAPAVLQRAEAAFGTRFSDVRVHVGPHASRLGAVAFTNGSDIHFAPGHYELHSTRGRHLLAHELAHVVQQRTGRVRNPFADGTTIVHDALLEAAAERIAQRVAPALAMLDQRQTAHPPPVARRDLAQRGSRNTRAIQRYGGALLVQSGPSCWLFVVEAIADLQHFDTWLLAGIMRLYPQGEIVGSTRQTRVMTISAICGRVVLKLQQARARGETVMSRDRIEEVVRRSMHAVGVQCYGASCVRHLFAAGGNYLLTDAVEVFRRGRRLAEAIAAGLGADGSTPAVMGGAATIIDQNSTTADIGHTLVALPNSYLSVSARPKPTNHLANYNAITDTYDLTGLGLAAIEAGGAHALLLHAVNAGAHQLTYKDPNYGDSKVIITFAQLSEMARRNGTVSVRTLHAGSTLTGALGGPAVAHPVPLPPAPHGPAIVLGPPPFVAAPVIGPPPFVAAPVIGAPVVVPVPVAPQPNLAAYVAGGIVVTGAILALAAAYIARQNGAS